jgi:asparagine synthetase B (glutamine-hydrolysing)
MAEKQVTMEQLRESMEIPNPSVFKPEKAVVTLAAKARILLRYSVLQKSLKSGLLVQCLAYLEIEALDAKLVQKYMDEMEDKMNNPSPSSRSTSKKRKFDDEDEDDDESDEQYAWEKSLLEDYNQPVPEFVLNKAVQIAEQVPETKFYVVHMERVQDPFLLVKLGGEEIYVEVWEEPLFEGRITNR